MNILVMFAHHVTKTFGPAIIIITKIDLLPSELNVSQKISWLKRVKFLFDINCNIINHNE